MFKTTQLLSGLVLVASLAMFGCGGDDDGDGGGGDSPTAAFTMTPDCTMSSAEQVTFTSTSTDPEDGDVSCDWTFGQCTAPAGCSSTVCTATGVTFPNANPYQVTLTVTDSDGNTDTLSQTIGPC